MASLVIASTLLVSLLAASPAPLDAWRPLFLPDTASGDSTIVGFTLESARGGTRPAKLVCQCGEDGLEVSLVADVPVIGAAAESLTRSVQLQFDDGAPVTQSWSLVEDRAALVAPEPTVLFRRISFARSLRIQLSRQGRTPALLQFDVAGFDRHRDGIERGCTEEIASDPASPDSADYPKFGEYVYVDELPEAITKVPPIYPEEAKRGNQEGSVMVQALVGPDGLVHDAKVTHSIPLLSEAAIASARLWTFKPAMKHGRPVAVWVAIPIKFSLH